MPCLYFIKMLSENCLRIFFEVHAAEENVQNVARNQKRSHCEGEKLSEKAKDFTVRASEL